MRKTRKNRLPQPSGYVKTAMSHGLLGVPKAAALLQTCQNMPPMTCFDVQNICFMHGVVLERAGKPRKCEKHGKTASHSPLPRGCVKNVLSRGQKEPLHTEDLKIFKFSHHILFCFIIPNDFAVRGRW